MAITKDPENGENIHEADITRSLIEKTRFAEDQSLRNSNASVWMVLLGTFVAVSGSFEFGTCVGFSSPAQSGIIADLGLSVSEYSFFGSLVTIGAMIGAVTSGRIADYIGRKGAMRMSAIFCTAGWLAIYFSKGTWSLDLGRLFGGYGTGVFSYVVPIYIAEITPKNLRGALTTVNQLMICTGVSVTFILGTVLKWRILALTGIVPCLISLLGLFFVPESPRWLAKVGRQNEFEVALRKLRGKDADISEEATEIQEFIETIQSLPKARIQDLLQRKYAPSVIIGVGLMVFQQFGGINGIIFYASKLFVDVGFSSGKVGSIALACLQVPVTALGALLMDKSGRRPLLLISTTGTLIGVFLTGIALFLKGHGLLIEFVPILALLGVLVYIGSFSFGLGATPWVIMSEIFPINVKGIAGSLVTLVNCFGSWAVSYTFNFLMSWSPPGTFFLYSGVSAIGVLFIAKLVPETKGRTLEEIQASMSLLSRERY